MTMMVVTVTAATAVTDGLSTEMMRWVEERNDTSARRYACADQCDAILHATGNRIGLKKRRANSGGQIDRHSHELSGEKFSEKEVTSM